MLGIRANGLQDFAGQIEDWKHAVGAPMPCLWGVFVAQEETEPLEPEFPFSTTFPHSLV